MIFTKVKIVILNIMGVQEEKVFLGPRLTHLVFWSYYLATSHNIKFFFLHSHHNFSYTSFLLSNNTILRLSSLYFKINQRT